jgi:glycine dehydrogenase
LTLEHGAFVDRHIGPTHANELAMLEQLGFNSLDTFISAVVPSAIAMKEPLEKHLPSAVTEVEAIKLLRQMASENEVFTSLIGTGYYGTVTPAVIKRNVLENPAWYTAYTPYQPERSPGSALCFPNCCLRSHRLNNCQRVDAR